MTNVLVYYLYQLCRYNLNAPSLIALLQGSYKDIINIRNHLSRATQNGTKSSTINTRAYL